MPNHAVTLRVAAQQLPYSPQALELLASRGHIEGATLSRGVWFLPFQALERLRATCSSETVSTGTVEIDDAS